MNPPSPIGSETTSLLADPSLFVRALRLTLWRCHPRAWGVLCDVPGGSPAARCFEHSHTYTLLLNHGYPLESRHPLRVGRGRRSSLSALDFLADRAAQIYSAYWSLRAAQALPPLANGWS